MKKLLIGLSLLTAMTLGAMSGCKSDRYKVGGKMCVTANGQEFNLDILAQFVHENAKGYVVLVKESGAIELVAEAVLIQYESKCSK